MPLPNHFILGMKFFNFIFSISLTCADLIGYNRLGNNVAFHTTRGYARTERNLQVDQIIKFLMKNKTKIAKTPSGRLIFISRWRKINCSIVIQNKICNTLFREKFKWCRLLFPGWNIFPLVLSMPVSSGTEISFGTFRSNFVSVLVLLIMVWLFRFLSCFLSSFDPVVVFRGAFLSFVPVCECSDPGRFWLVDFIWSWDSLEIINSMRCRRHASISNCVISTLKKNDGNFSGAGLKIKIFTPPYGPFFQTST